MFLWTDTESQKLFLRKFTFTEKSKLNEKFLLWKFGAIYGTRFRTEDVSENITQCNLCSHGWLSQAWWHILVLSARNKDQKLVGRFLKTGYFIRRLLIVVPLRMYRKFGQPKWILVSQMLKLVRKWLTVLFLALVLHILW